MKIPTRLEQAITKLYLAFHSGALHPECCNSCAVGNICDNTDTWKYLTESHGSLELSYIGRVNENFDRKIHGYSPKELLQIEVIFLKGCGFSVPLVHGSNRPKNPTDKDLLFNGLCDTIEFLCKLDNIPNVMDYSKLFEYVDDAPKYELPQFVDQDYKYEFSRTYWHPDPGIFKRDRGFHELHELLKKHLTIILI